jgi:hypothetical protein
MNALRRRRWGCLGLILSVMFTIYCVSGVIMNADFATMAPGAQSAGHILAARIFTALTLAGLLSLLFCSVVLWRARRSANRDVVK